MKDDMREISERVWYIECKQWEEQRRWNEAKEKEKEVLEVEEKKKKKKKKKNVWVRK